ncbi:tripartite tricarboxylate transporter substrate binding protein [soil metagenome]
MPISLSIRRRDLLGAAALAPWLPSAHAAIDYPARNVTLTVPFTPGQSGDILARLLAEALTKHWGKSVIVDNRPGAGGALGSQTVMRAAPDGYTLLLSSSGPIAIAPHLIKNIGYDSQRDFTPIMNAAGVAQVLAVSGASPYKNAQDLIAAAKKAPGKLNYGSGGSGSTQHLTMELFKQRTGIELTHIPYKGSAPAYTDMLGGQIDALFDSLPGVLPFIKGGQVRVLAVSTAKRDPTLPDVPTLQESGVAGFDVLGWLGVMGPAGLDKGVRDRINESLKQVLAMPAVKDSMLKLGMQQVGGSPDDFAKYIASELARWGDVIKTAGIKAE